MTPQEALAKQLQIYRQMTGQQRLQIAFDLYDLSRALVRAGLRHQHPDWTESQVDHEVVRRFMLAAGINQELDNLGWIEGKSILP